MYISIKRVGWLGEEILEEDQGLVRDRLLAEHNCIPVFIPDELANNYYNGFSNDVLWPLFHYVPLPMYKAGGEKKFDYKLWEAYQEANILFSDVVVDIYTKGDYVWVHDYHLMYLPFELRQKKPDIKIGWFLHTPFPSSETGIRITSSQGR